MKPKTDPKTMTTRAVLSAADVSAACRVLDMLRLAAVWEKDKVDPCPQLADALEDWIIAHQPATQKPTTYKDEERSRE